MWLCMLLLFSESMDVQLNEKTSVQVTWSDLPALPDGSRGVQIDCANLADGANDAKIMAYQIIYSLNEKLAKAPELRITGNNHEFRFEQTEDHQWIHQPNISSTEYVNRLLGISISRHEDWHFHWTTEPEDSPATQEKRAIRLKQVLKFATLNNHLSITRFPEPYAGVNPTINLSVYPITFDSEHVARDYLEQIMTQSQSEVLQAPVATKMGGRDAWHARMNARAIVAGENLKMTVDLWAVVDRGQVIFINAGYPADAEQLVQWASESQSMVSSLKFVQ